MHISNAYKQLNLKNVHGDKKQFIKAIGFTSPQGIQIAVTPFNVEVYEDGNLKHIYEIDQQGTYNYVEYFVI